MNSNHELDKIQAQQEYIKKLEIHNTGLVRRVIRLTETLMEILDSYYETPRHYIPVAVIREAEKELKDE